MNNDMNDTRPQIISNVLLRPAGEWENPWIPVDTREVSVMDLYYNYILKLVSWNVVSNRSE
jgi:hypothetical protein